MSPDQTHIEASESDESQDQLLRLEKRHDYRNVTLTLVVMMIIGLISEDFLKMLGWVGSGHTMWYLFQVCMAFYLYLLWDLFRNFTSQKILKRAALTWIVGIFGISFIWNNFLYDPSWVPHMNAWLHLGVFGLEAVIISLATHDLLSGPRNTVDKLWASAAIYFMFGFACANLFAAIQLVEPDAYGPLPNRELSGYFEGLYLSFTALSGADNAYDKLSHLIRNLGLLEATVGQLYLVLLIGRVLLPEEESSP